MANKRYGDPVLTMRIPAWEITALQIIAREQGQTVSELLRQYISQMLAARGYSDSGTTVQTIPGQLSALESV